MSPVAIGIDIGGTGIKAAAVDLEAGDFAGERVRIPTPNPPTPDAVMETAAKTIAGLPADAAVGVGFPGAFVDGELSKARGHAARHAKPHGRQGPLEVSLVELLMEPLELHQGVTLTGHRSSCARAPWISRVAVNRKLGDCALSFPTHSPTSARIGESDDRPQHAVRSVGKSTVHSQRVALRRRQRRERGQKEERQVQVRHQKLTVEER